MINTCQRCLAFMSAMRPEIDVKKLCGKCVVNRTYQAQNTRTCVCGKPAIIGAFCSTECADSAMEWGIGAAKIDAGIVGEINEILRGK